MVVDLRGEQQKCYTVCSVTGNLKRSIIIQSSIIRSFIVSLLCASVRLVR